MKMNEIKETCFQVVKNRGSLGILVGWPCLKVETTYQCLPLLVMYTLLFVPPMERILERERQKQNKVVVIVKTIAAFTPRSQVVSLIVHDNINRQQTCPKLYSYSFIKRYGSASLLNSVEPSKRHIIVLSHPLLLLALLFYTVSGESS